MMTRPAATPRSWDPTASAGRSVVAAWDRSFEATDEITGELVAVKLIAAHANEDERFRRRFEAEFKALDKLRHPGIVRLIGHGQQAGRMFYSMERVRGRTLHAIIRESEGKRLDWQTALPWAIQIASALKHAHDYGIIHRDLKPANLIISDEHSDVGDAAIGAAGGPGRVKIVDFGIAKVFGVGEQTLAGSVLGTADFMAPEQAGDGPITPRTDLYALGSVMYAMLAGRAPFAGRRGDRGDRVAAAGQTGAAGPDPPRVARRDRRNRLRPVAKRPRQTAADGPQSPQSAAVDAFWGSINATPPTKCSRSCPRRSRAR